MSAEKQQIFRSPAKPYPHFGMSSYVIEVDFSDRHRPLQRHIWTTCGGAVEEGDWVPTFFEDTQNLLSLGWIRVAPKTQAA